MARNYCEISDEVQNERGNVREIFIYIPFDESIILIDILFLFFFFNLKDKLKYLSKIL